MTQIYYKSELILRKSNTKDFNHSFLLTQSQNSKTSFHVTIKKNSASKFPVRQFGSEVFIKMLNLTPESVGLYLVFRLDFARSSHNKDLHSYHDERMFTCDFKRFQFT